ncbi:MAG: EKC/KEOPS complex subunit CGI121/TPRKB [Candidatus Marsarchaeota archaeon]|nr:EKC/KEOPS complex subunit CGI121/TPRKB [Candidatus Marsarchaeota archaeon]
MSRLQGDMPEFTVKPAAWVCSSSKPLAELISASKKASSGSETVLLVHNSKEAAKRLLPAFVNATLRIASGASRSKSTQIEMLLLLCGTMNIGKALRDCGAKDGKSFLLFATSQHLLERFSKAHAISAKRRLRLDLDMKISGEVSLTEFQHG